MEVNEINPDWLLREIAKLNSQVHAPIRQMHLDGLKKEILSVLNKHSEKVEVLEERLNARFREMPNYNVQMNNLLIVMQNLERAFEARFKKLEEKMTKLTTKARKALPKKAFAEPAERKYPVNDKAHARNAKARASEMEHKGKISKAAEDKIDRKADKVLKKGKKK